MSISYVYLRPSPGPHYSFNAQTTEITCHKPSRDGWPSETSASQLTEEPGCPVLASLGQDNDSILAPIAVYDGALPGGPGSLPDCADSRKPGRCTALLSVAIGGSRNWAPRALEYLRAVFGTLLPEKRLRAFAHRLAVFYAEQAPRVSHSL
jgi:hypothetical protein